MQTAWPTRGRLGKAGVGKRIARLCLENKVPFFPVLSAARGTETRFPFWGKGRDSAFLIKPSLELSRKRVDFALGVPRSLEAVFTLYVYPDDE